MATASSTPTGQDSDTSILHLFVEFILKKREKGLNAAAIVEALAGPSSVGSSATRRRTTSESRKAQRSTSVRPSTTSAARAHRNIGTGVVKAPKYVSFEEYHLKYADQVVCTFLPLRGKNENTVCCAEIDDPDTSDRAQFRCKTHEKSGFEASVQRYKRFISGNNGTSSSRTSGASSTKIREDPVVSDRHQPGGSAARRVVGGMPKAMTRTVRSSDRTGEDIDSYNGLTGSKTDDTDDTPKTDTPPQPTSRLASRLTGLGSRTTPSKDAVKTEIDVKPEDTVSKTKDDAKASASTESEDERPKPKASDIKAAEVRERPSRLIVRPSRSGDAGSPTKARSVSRSRDDHPRDDRPSVQARKDRSASITRQERSVSHRGRSEERRDRSVTPKSEVPRRSTRIVPPVKEKSPQREVTPKAVTPKAVTPVHSETEQSETDVPKETDANTEGQQLEVYSVPNVENTDWIKIDESRFIGVDLKTDKVIGIYPLSIEDGVRISSTWKNKLTTNYTEDDIAIMTQLGLNFE